MASFPTLVVTDIQASARWYGEALGFTHVFSLPGPDGVPALAHLRWIKVADRLRFPARAKAPAHTPRGVGVALNYSTGAVEGLARRARRHNARIVERPVHRPGNIGELVLLDPDGYRLVFNGPRTDGQPCSFDDIVAGAARGFEE